MFQILWALINSVQHKWNCLIDLGKNPMLAYIYCSLSFVTHCQHAKHFSCVLDT